MRDASRYLVPTLCASLTLVGCASHAANTELEVRAAESAALPLSATGTSTEIAADPAPTRETLPLAPAAETRGATDALATLPQDSGYEQRNAFDMRKRSTDDFIHHVSAWVGETGTGGEHAFTLGADYEQLWNERWQILDHHWGVGAQISLATGPIESTFVAPQLVYHPVPQAGLIIAPGYAFNSNRSDSWTLRTGMKWEFEVAQQVSLAPVFFYDIMEAGERAGVFAIAVGYGF